MKTIVHLDLNKTCMMADPISGKTPEDVFISALAEDLKYQLNWSMFQWTPQTFQKFLHEENESIQFSPDELQKSSHSPRSKTFYRFVQDDLYPFQADVDRQTRRDIKLQGQKAVFSFLKVMKKIKHPEYSHAEARFQQAMKALTTASEDLRQAIAESKMEFKPSPLDSTDPSSPTLNQEPALLVPAFYHLVFWLETRKQKYGEDYVIIFRTFGSDLPNVLNTLKVKTHPAVTSKLTWCDPIDSLVQIPIPMNFSKIACFENGVYHPYGVSRPSSSSHSPSGIENYVDVYAHWCQSKDHFAVRDDYYWWNDHAEKASYGKPFIFDSSRDKEHLVVFFDDNIENHPRNDPNPDHNIIAPYDLAKNCFVSVSQVLNEGRAYIVNPLEVMLDDQYFVKCLENTLRHRQGVETLQSGYKQFLVGCKDQTFKESIESSSSPCRDLLPQGGEGELATSPLYFRPRPSSYPSPEPKALKNKTVVVASKNVLRV